MSSERRRSPRFGQQYAATAVAAAPSSLPEIEGLVISGPGESASDNQHQVHPSPSSPLPPENSHTDANDDDDLPLIFLSRSDFVDSHIPRSNLEALYTHCCPVFLSTNVVTPSSTTQRYLLHPSFCGGSRNRPRVSNHPPSPSGNSRSSTNKEDLLLNIMQNDPLLREQGVRIEYDLALHLTLSNRLLARLRTHSDSPFINDWLLALRHQIQVLRSHTLTDETTTTGVFRSTLYHMCSIFTKYTGNFQSLEEHSFIEFGIWSDPPSSPRSILDVACYSTNGKCFSGAEHKRPIVVDQNRMRTVQTGASQMNSRQEPGILVTVQDGQLAYENYDSDEKGRSLLSQVRKKKGNQPQINDRPCEPF